MKDRIGRLREQANMKVNLGCGIAHETGFVNVDLHGSPDVRADARSLPFPDSSVDLLECHHMLEHFTLAEGFKVIGEWGRVIKPKGYLVVTVPDLLAMLRFMQETRNIIEMWPGLMMYIFGQDGPGMQHLSAYTPEYLTFRLKEAGFSCEVIPWPYRPTASFGVIACRR